MRIGIDARLHGAHHTGGIGRYLESLLVCLANQKDAHTYVVFLRKENFHECPNAPHFEKRLVDIPVYSLAEQWHFVREIRHAGVDIMHYPHWNVPLLSRVPFIVTIHDTILLDDPESAHASTRGVLVHALKYLAFRLTMEKAVHASRKVIAVSHTTKKSIEKHFRIKNAQKVVVIENIAEPIHAKEEPTIQPPMVPYILYAGSCYPHKNLDMLCQAWGRVHQNVPNSTLVIAGKGDAFMSALRKKYPQVTYIPSPSDADLEILYNNCRAFVFPSRHEGFGFPPLEAIYANKTTIIADIPVLQEICGIYAYAVDPLDQQSWAAYMIMALEGRLPARANVHAIDVLQKKYGRDIFCKKLETLYGSLA